jgi:hypothetical protein
MFYLPITKGWILSPLANRIYFVCALLAIALFGTLVATFLAVAVSGVQSLADAPSGLLLVKVLIFPGVCGTALLSIAMWYFWLSFDQSSWTIKAFWFLPLYLLLPIGPGLYYFFVYRRQTPAPQSPGGTTETAAQQPSK